MNKYFYESEARRIAALNEIFGRCGTDCGRNADAGMAVLGGRNATVETLLGYPKA
ncbi:MAG: hypothetical protein ACLSGB_15765 [Dorea sp.]